MTGYERPDEDYQPLTWFRGYPIHATHLLVAGHVAALLVTTLLQIAAPHASIVGPLMFSTDQVVHHFAYWQLLTYAFVHDLSINFLFGMLMLFWFGWETERFLGRRMFLILYGILILVAPFTLLLASAATHTDLSYAGSFAVDFGIFIAFAVIYPNVQIFFSLITKWVALVLVIFHLLYFASLARVSSPAPLLVFVASMLVAYFGARYAGAGGGLAFLSTIRQSFPRKGGPSGIKPRLKPRRLVESGPTTVSTNASPSRSSSAYGSSGELHDSIDPLLDKISKHGLASLTHSERAALERARVSLLRKERGSS